MRNGRLGAMWLAAGWWAVLAACSSGGSSGSEAAAVAACEELATAHCERLVECNPLAAAAAYDARAAADCPAGAKAVCAADEGGGDDDGCEPPVPSASDIASCKSEIETVACDAVVDALSSGVCGTLQTCEEPADDDTPADDDDTPADDDDIPVDDDDAPADDDDAPVDDDDDTPTVNTAGCEAAVAAMCPVASACADELPALPAAVETALEGCDASVASHSAEVGAACQAYLEEGLATNAPLAIYLNGASPAAVEACVTGQNCTREFLLAAAGALGDFLDSGSAEDLVALLGPLVSGCYD